MNKKKTPTKATNTISKRLIIGLDDTLFIFFIDCYKYLVWKIIEKSMLSTEQTFEMYIN